MGRKTGHALIGLFGRLREPLGSAHALGYSTDAAQEAVRRSSHATEVAQAAGELVLDQAIFALAAHHATPKQIAVSLGISKRVVTRRLSAGHYATTGEPDLLCYVLAAWKKPAST